MSPNAKGPNPSWKHAVVIGSGMAGLLASRVLAEHFDRVTVVERDHLPKGPEFRSGIPQAWHIHVMLLRGEGILKQLFPGFYTEMEAAGAVVFDWCQDIASFNYGNWRLRFPSKLRSHVCSRPLIEWMVRRRLSAYTNICFREGCSVSHLLFNSDKTRVTGIQTLYHGKKIGETIEADLTVDASGRNTKTPHWLKSAGYSTPEESVVNVYLGYSSRIYQRPKDFDRGWKLLGINEFLPYRRAGLLHPLEGNRWLVTLAANLRHYPPSDEEGFLRFAFYLPHPELYESIKEAKPLSSIHTYRMPGSLRRHYEQMPRWPEGFIVIGDAVCSLNPIYGQGMSVSAMEAIVLDRYLQKQRLEYKGSLTGFSRRFQKQLSSVIEDAWLMSTSEDFRYPQTEGRRTLGIKILQWYIGQTRKLSAKDKKTLVRFFEVWNLLKKPSGLFHPSIVFQMLISWLRFRSFLSSTEKLKLDKAADSQ